MRKLLTLLLACIVLIVPIHAQDAAPTDSPTTTEGVLFVLSVEDGVRLEADAQIAVRDILAERVAAAGYDTFSVRAIPPGKFLITLEDESELNLTETFITFLTDPGFVEFVDFADVLPGEGQNMVGVSVVTSAQVERFPGDNPPEATYNTVLTGDHITAAFARPLSGGGGVESLRDLLEGIIASGGEPNMDEASTDWTLEFELDEDGAEILYDYTSNNIGGLMAIVINGEVVTAPIIQTALREGGIISGLTRTEAITLAEQLRSGVLPVALTLQTATFYREVRFGGE